MAVTVRVSNSNARRISTNTPTASVRLGTSVTNTSKTQTSTTLDGLSGVDLTGVANGYTLVYDSETGHFEAAPAAEVAANIQNIDGGTF